MKNGVGKMEKEIKQIVERLRKTIIKEDLGMNQVVYHKEYYEKEVK